MKYFVYCVSLILLIFVHTVFTSVSITASSTSVDFLARTPFTLTCDVSSDDKTEVKWEKDGEKLSDVDRMKGRTTITKDGKRHKLKVHHTVDDDAGNYTCIAYQNGNEESSARILVISKIAVKVPSNINVVEAEKLRIHCNVIGKPYPRLHWFYENTTYKETFNETSGRVILEEDPDKKVPNAILKIIDIQMFDRGEFQCIGTSELTNVTDVSKCYVRVKDKYAALWPFLGICAEVIVLCAIIFIYEKKRNKTELEESDTDQSPDQKNTPDHGKDSNLRHRQ